MASLLVRFMVISLIQTSYTLHYVGKFPYHDLVSSLQSEKICTLHWNNRSTFLETDSKIQNGTNCLFFLEPPRDWSKNFKLAKVNVVSSFNNYEYNFALKCHDCKSKDIHVSQSIQSLLICQWKKAVVGKTCDEGLGCDEKRESCQEHPRFQRKFCIPKGKTESCKNNSQCLEDAECKHKDERKTRQCLHGNMSRNGSCLKVERKLFESCERDIQCSGTDGADTCKAFGDFSICFCNGSKIQYEGKCLEGRRYLGDMCETNKQCTGTRNARVCDDHKCTCNGGFYKVNKGCVKGKKLFESCERHIQCSGTEGAGICKAFGNVTICVCDDGKIQYEGKCIEGQRSLDDTCETDQQCTGTRHAGVCDNYICTCNGGFDKVNKECVTGGKKLFESCERHIQCSGTEGAGICKAFGNVTICFCDDGKIQYEGKCIEGQRNLDDTCETDQQCTGTRHAGVCDNYICTCNGGFDKVNKECVTETSQSWIYDKDNQLVLAGTGGFLFGVICSSVPLLFICCRKRKSRSSSSSRHAPSIKIYHGHQTNSAHQDELSSPRGNQIVHSIDENQSQPIYNELNESAEQVPNNVYDVTHAMFSGGSSDDAVYSYNHLHEKESQLCANIYDVSHTSGSFKNGKNMADQSKESKE